MRQKKRYTYEVFRPASEMPKESDGSPWDEPGKKPRRLSKAAQLAVNHGTFAVRGVNGDFIIRPLKGWLTPHEVRDVIALFYGRSVTIKQIEEWAQQNVGPLPDKFEIKYVSYEFYDPYKIIEWLEMSERCREERKWGRTGSARVIETQYGYGAIPSRFMEWPSQCDRHGKPLYQDITVAPEKIRKRFEKAMEGQRKAEERLRIAKERGFLADQNRRTRNYKKRLANQERIKARREALAARQSLTTEPEDASTPPVPITSSRHEDTPDD